MPAIPSIFISYRIADSLTQAGRLHQSLEAEFGKGTVFYDKSNLKPGMKWDEELAGKVRRAAVVLVLIVNKSKWLGVGDEGRRIDEPDDWVRQEVEAALGDSQKLVIPVLINDAQLPTEKAFSTDETKGLLPLLKRQHKQIREANWDDDLLPLMRTLREHINYDPGAGNADRNQNNPKTNPAFHAYTCDRDQQYDRFDNLRAAIQPGSVHFFYLYGGELQAHKSFFKRVKYDLQGKYLELPEIDATNKNAKKKTVAAVDFVVDSDGASGPERLRERFVRNLFAALGLGPGAYHPLTQQNLQNLLLESEKTRDLRAGDHLCVFAHISHWYWNPDHTPDAARWFVQTFCPRQLPDDSPAVLFFAFDFNEADNPGVCEEVRAAIQREAEQVVALPELDMVQKRHIQQWLVRYQRYFSPPLRQLIVAQYFSDPEYFMEHLEPKLQELINHYFNKQVE